MAEEMTMTDEERWQKDGETFDWTLPPKAAWPLRLPIVRFVRAFVLLLRVDKHERRWRSIGALPSGYDRWVLFGIAKGWC